MNTEVYYLNFVSVQSEASSFDPRYARPVFDNNRRRSKFMEFLLIRMIFIKV